VRPRRALRRADRACRLVARGSVGTIPEPEEDSMAELTVLDEKLAEVLGLAQAAQQATRKVSQLARREGEGELVELLQRMSAEAADTAQRCQQVADEREGLKTAIREKARETKREVAEFMETYLEDAEALDGLEFLSMAEAGELAHWEILDTLNRRARETAVRQLVESVLPIQRRHVNDVRESSLRLAADEDPSEPA
jgi:hypothetical protein